MILNCPHCHSEINTLPKHNNSQENLIGKILVLNDKINWKYRNPYMGIKAKKEPLTIAACEIQMGILWFDIYYSIHSGITGRIYVRGMNNKTKRKYSMEDIDLSTIKDITTDKIYNIIINWWDDYKQEVILA